MSYLDVPRLHFAGRFSAAPSTINNSKANYSRTEIEIDKISPGWNPNGNHYWQFHGCTVRGVVGADGSAAGAGGGELIGAAVESTNQPHIAKLVDLDTEQQMVSQIWGLNVRFAAANGDSFEGSFRAVPFNDIWGRAQSGGGMSGAGAYYQSVLDNVTWGAKLKSPLLRKLKALSPKTLSIKFMVDGFQPDASQPDFTFGRLVGTIGPAAAAEPINFVPERFLRPLDGSVNFAPARIDKTRRRVLVDLGNSLPFVAPNGPLADIGDLQLAILPADQSQQQLLGPVGNVAYELNAGVYEFPLTAAQINLLKSTPLGVVRVDGGSTQTLLTENSAGAYLNATQYVFRLNPGDKPAQVTLVATAFGAPKANQKINLTGKTFSGQPITGNPPPLKFPATVTTNSQGRAAFTLTPADPGDPRGPIDGQVYKIEFAWDSPPADYNRDPNEFLSVLVFSGYDVPASPKWADIAPIFDEYAKMYPFMKATVDLSDYATVKQFAGRIAQVMGYPETDPRYMPVTRDLSKNKRQTILKWIKNGAPL